MDWETPRSVRSYKAQPECQSPGTRVLRKRTSPDRCYCSYASTPTSGCAIGCHGDPNCGDKSCTLSNARLACPTVVDRRIGRRRYVVDTFAVTQQGAKVTVVRTDSRGLGRTCALSGPNQVIQRARRGRLGRHVRVPRRRRVPRGRQRGLLRVPRVRGRHHEEQPVQPRDGAWSRQKVICAPRGGGHAQGSSVRHERARLERAVRHLPARDDEPRRRRPVGARTRGASARAR